MVVEEEEDHGAQLDSALLEKTTFIVIEFYSEAGPCSDIGLFVEAILEQPGMTTGGMTVSAFTEQTTPEKLLQSWAKVNGKKALYVEDNIETFTALWTNAGVDILPKMMEFHWYMDKNPWVGSENILTKDDLCVKGLLSVEESFEVLKS
ncbi:hypothetical protein BDV33DRAFT_200464 [Aspergillus novoparasiticus]|uniref:Thioredoxin-like protein n=1 Tax=Aspergillus novoparasiticus TaxID=986946 RepID=A0A5N6F1X2_9EURO|nr:hypothetical protein BDV33DRAFT_200464 [Aspergillus novoparasiticus]